MGELIEFHRPPARLPKKPVVEDNSKYVQDVLEVLNTNKDDIEDIAVLIVDKEGVSSIVSTLDCPAEILLFMERFKQNIVNPENQLPDGVA